MDARVLIKHSTSKCNEKLLTWLHSNINTIKKSINLKVIVVYEKHYSKLGNKITKLPALILNGTLVTGNSEIKKYITNAINAGGKKTGKSNIEPVVCDDLAEYWNKEMHSGLDDDDACNEADDLMDAVKRRALDATMTHKENTAKKPARRETVVSSARQDNILLDNIKPDKISDMVGNDPMMQKFWENQEETPSFGN